ncbi:hypothetical protein INN71_15135 [Nocardioides sp. ChNu-153]|uniref:hypothetical protein n=1 Tax=unclassified Nocardioides TaxID=2615069 RepID=UPI002404EFF3|nr:MULTISPECIES: hypothetical protein [unclassified Nocardioides]MDF9716315.1 hypothetical protein [Nocardioides sp. ChNu-99]MDN7122723.1 hypothetical protein [Nocardioides sp. ChNu-153]
MDGEWFSLRGKSAIRDLWVAPEWEGQPKLGPWLLPDGREIPRLIEDGQADELGFPFWFRQVEGSRGRRRGDLLWGGGSRTKVVSRRFVDALGELGVLDDLMTYPAAILDRRRRVIEADYLGLVEPIGRGEVRAGLTTQRNSMLTVSARVLEGLRERGVTEFEAEPTERDVEPWDGPPLFELSFDTVVFSRAKDAVGVYDEALAEHFPAETFEVGDRALRDVLTFDDLAMDRSLWAAVAELDGDVGFPLDRVIASCRLLGMSAAAEAILSGRAALVSDPPAAVPDVDLSVRGSGDAAYDEFSFDGLWPAVQAVVAGQPQLFGAPSANW